MSPRSRALAPLSAGALALGALLATPAQALAAPSPLGLTLPGIHVGAPGAGGERASPGISLGLPGLPIELPSIKVEVPAVKVEVPSVKVEVPAVGVGVTTPSVEATTPTVTTGSGGTTSTPSPPTETPTEAPASGGGASGGSGGSQGAGSGSAGGTGKSGGGSGTSSTATPAAHSASASSSESATAAVTGAGAHGGASHGGSHRKRAGGSGGSGGGSGSSGSRAGATGAVTLLGTAARVVARDASAVRAAHTPAKRASNPLEAIGKNIPLPIPVPDWSKPIILALLALALWFGTRAFVTGRRARRLERQREVLLADVDAMQAALVPAIPARMGGLAVSVAYKPAEGPAAGGDFYDVFVPEKGKVAIILGDVAGHGHTALTQAALTRYTLRAYLQTGLEPRAALALAGRVLAAPAAEHFATVIVGVYDKRAGTLTYASAGHPPPIIHGLRTREPLFVCASPPIGWTVPTGLRQTTVSLPRGSIVCFYSDGLVEARCKDDLLGRERLSDMLGELGLRPPADRLLASVSGEADATPDDMAACVVVPEMAVVAGNTHVEELEVDAQALSSGQARRFLETCELPLHDVEHTISRAGDIAAVFGTALLRVQLAGAAQVRTEVLTPSAPPQAPGKVARLRPAGEPEPSPVR